MFRVALNRVCHRAGAHALSYLKQMEPVMKPMSTMSMRVISPTLSSQRMTKSIQTMEMHSSAKTKGNSEIVVFLNEEIATEKKTSKPLPKKLDDFEAVLEGSVVTLTKKFNAESIVITFNVNHTVDAEPVEEGAQGAEEGGEMKSRPHFDVDIVKGNQTLTFSCSYAEDDGEQQSEGQEDYNDLFVIDEVALYEGEAKDSTYAVAGDILDGYLYDLFMNMLEERGVTNEFVEKLSDYSTSYEHSLYVQLLSKLQSFVSN